MNTNQKTFNAFVAAALLTAVGARAAEQGEQATFIPFEQLQPEQRELIGNKIKELLLHFKVDFSTVKVGIDQEGNIIFKGRTEAEIKMNPAGSPTCWTW